MDPHQLFPIQDPLIQHDNAINESTWLWGQNWNEEFSNQYNAMHQQFPVAPNTEYATEMAEIRSNTIPLPNCQSADNLQVRNLAPQPPTLPENPVNSPLDVSQAQVTGNQNSSVTYDEPKKIRVIGPLKTFIVKHVEDSDLDLPPKIAIRNIWSRMRSQSRQWVDEIYIERCLCNLKRKRREDIMTKNSILSHHSFDWQSYKKACHDNYRKLQGSTDGNSFKN